MHAAFASVFTVVAPWAGRLARAWDVDMFDNAAHLVDVACPIAFVHATDDRLLPLADHCTPKRLWRVGGGHGAPPPQAVVDEVAKWITSFYSYASVTPPAPGRMTVSDSRPYASHERKLSSAYTRAIARAAASTTACSGPARSV